MKLADAESTAGVDHADDASAAALFAQIANEQGPLDILVNNAAKLVGTTAQVRSGKPLERGGPAAGAPEVPDRRAAPPADLKGSSCRTCLALTITSVFA
jgi:NAD(P)-dependent dehydrogenase (short-subunit alcohol dehydrogenase family)